MDRRCRGEEGDEKVGGRVWGHVCSMLVTVLGEGEVEFVAFFSDEAKERDQLEVMIP